ncbi:phage holin family protein [Nocardioides massiliensis]|uniref:Membrane protein n=1 Tax=Nocardioides massiliensis TaxID=1325935 RepID=A0ABT9NMH5_9ACTN|nr:phage holin family protein [Nocardioides massiliensis]MDP9821447.1 putative membrane protein [Nocardioides massiliensis]
MNFLLKVLASAAGLTVAAWLLDGITITGDSDNDRVLTLVIVAAIFGIIDSFVAPVIKVLSIPFIILTLGLFLLVVNALMLMLTSWVADQVGLGFAVDGFWTAVVGSVIITVVSWIAHLILPDAR